MKRILLLFLLLSTHCYALDVSGAVGSDLQFDDNIFLLPPAFKSVQPHNGADSIVSATASLTAQTGTEALGATGHTTIQRFHFLHDDLLDNTGIDAGVSVDAEQQRGSVHATAAIVRRLTSFQDVRTVDRALQRLDSLTVDATRAVLGDFRVIGGAALTRSTNSNPIVALADYRRAVYRGGFGYYSPAGNVLALEYRRTDATGLNDLPALLGGRTIVYRASYSEQAVQLHLIYAPSSLVQLDLRAGHAQHHDKSGVAGDFTGFTGQLSARWNPRNTLRVSTLASRDYQSDTGVLANGVRITRVNVTIDDEIMPLVSAELVAERSWRDYRYDVTAGTLSAARRDRITSAQATLRYSPSQRFTVSADGSIGRRTSTNALFRYADRQIGVSLQFNFGKGPAIG